MATTKHILDDKPKHVGLAFKAKEYAAELERLLKAASAEGLSVVAHTDKIVQGQTVEVITVQIRSRHANKVVYETGLF